MPIDSVHPAYAARYSQWERCSDCYEGMDAVKRKGSAYLPKLSGQEEGDYGAYLTRAGFYNATQRTVSGLVGALFRIEPVVKLPDSIVEYTDDVTHRARNGVGLSLVEFAKMVATELFVSSRAGILVDRGVEEGARPYFVFYNAASITNWGENFIVLREDYFENVDAYTVTAARRYRELRLEGGVYTVRIWKKAPKTAASQPDEWTVIETITPKLRGESMTEIPFTFVTPVGATTEVQKPLVLDLADINLGWYRNSADLEHGLHYTALPTPWASGLGGSDSKPTLKIGPSEAWLLPLEGARAGYLEFSGSGLGAIISEMDRKEDRMAAMGAALIAPRRRGIEAAETARIHQAGETSVLSGIAGSVDAALEAGYKFWARWDGVDDADVDVMLNRDFVDTRLGPADLTALFGIYQGAGISLDTFLFNLKRGEIIPPDTTVEEEREKIELQQPDAQDVAAAAARRERLARARRGEVEE